MASVVKGFTFQGLLPYEHCQPLCGVNVRCGTAWQGRSGEPQKGVVTRHRQSLHLEPEKVLQFERQGLPFVRGQLELEQLLMFERQGHTCVRGLFDVEEVKSLAVSLSEAADSEKLTAYRQRLSVLCPGIDPYSVNTIKEAERIIRQKGTDDLGFLQTFNLHQRSQVLRRWASHPRLCGMVATLLGTKRIRLYQDCLFLKFPGFGVTNWHSDLNMVPLDTNSFLTVWIPLRSLQSNDSNLHFASGSHRDFALAYWQSNQGMADLQGRGYPIESYSNLALGDVTVHHGWTLHWAPEQPSNQPPRVAWTVSYFADGACMLHTKHARLCSLFLRSSSSK